MRYLDSLSVALYKQFSHDRACAIGILTVLLVLHELTVLHLTGLTCAIVKYIGREALLLGLGIITALLLDSRYRRGQHSYHLQRRDLLAVTTGQLLAYGGLSILLVIAANSVQQAYL